jgi:hypothetical protein
LEHEQLDGKILVALEEQGLLETHTPKFRRLLDDECDGVLFIVSLPGSQLGWREDTATPVDFSRKELDAFRDEVGYSVGKHWGLVRMLKGVAGSPPTSQSLDSGVQHNSPVVRWLVQRATLALMRVMQQHVGVLPLQKELEWGQITVHVSHIVKEQELPPQQGSACTCGLYVLAFALFLSHGAEVSMLKKHVTSSYIELLRVRLQTLFAGEFKHSLRASELMQTRARRGGVPADVRALLERGPLLGGRLRLERQREGVLGLMATDWLSVSPLSL